MADVTKVAETASKTANNAGKVASNVASTTAKSVPTTGTVSTTTVPKSTSTQVVSEPSAQGTSFKENLRAINDSNTISPDYENGMDVSDEFDEGEKIAPGKVVKDGKVADSDAKAAGKAAMHGVEAFLTFYSGGTAAVGKEVVKEGGEKIAGEGIKQGLKGAGEATKKELENEVKKEAVKTTAQGAGKQFASAAGDNAKKGIIAKGAEALNSNEMIGDATKSLGNVMKGLEKAGDKVADVADKTPIIKETNKFNRELNTSINSVFDAISNVFSGNFSDALNNLGSAVKDGLKYTGKVTIANVILLFLSLLLSIFIVALPILIILIPITSVTQLIESTVADLEQSYSTDAGASIYGAGLYMTEAVKAVVGEVPGFESLSNGRKVVVVAGATAIGTNYVDGGKPTDPSATGISGGIDSSGLLEWVFWNVTGTDTPISVLEIGSNSSFEAISESDLKPGDIGVNGSEAGIYLGDGNWVHIDSSVGVIRGSYSGFTSFYKYKDIDTITVNAGGSNEGYYYGDGPTGEFRDRLIGWGGILHGMKIPYCNIPGQNVSYSLDVNAAGFWTVIPGKTLDPNEINRKKLKGLDCGGFVSYVYFLTTGGKWKGNLNYLLYNTPVSGFQKIPKEQAQKGDVVIMPGSHVMMLDHIEPDGKLFVYEMSGCDEGTRTINGMQIRYKGSTSVGSYCNGGYCKNHECDYYTYVGEE